MTVFLAYYNGKDKKYLMGPFANEKKAGETVNTTVIKSEAELAASPASIGEITRFYNTKAPENAVVKSFKDKATAARRTWALMVAADGAPAPVANKPAPATKGTKPTPPATKGAKPAPTPPATKPVVETGKRGRKPGSGEFAGKTVFAKKDANPRRAGTAGFKSYELIRGKKDGVPYADYIAAGGRPVDLRWDLERKWAEVK